MILSRIPYASGREQLAATFEVTLCSTERHRDDDAPAADVLVLLTPTRTDLRLLHAWPCCNACADRMVLEAMRDDVT